MKYYTYRNPSELTTEEEYLKYVENETAERNNRHRRCLDCLGIGVEERIDKNEPKSFIYRDKHGNKLATHSNVIAVPFNTIITHLLYDLIRSVPAIHLGDGRTIKITDDFDNRDKDGNYTEFITTVNVYDTIDYKSADEDPSRKPIPIVTAVYHIDENKADPVVEIKTAGVEMVVSNTAFYFRVAQDNRSREIEFDGELASYVEEVSGNGNDRAKGTVAVKRKNGRCLFIVGHGDKPLVKDVTNTSFLHDKKSLAIITSDRAQEVMNKAIEIVEQRLGHNNQFRNNILNMFTGMSIFLRNGKQYKQEEIEDLVNYVKVGRLNFGGKGSVFVEPDPQKLTLE